MPPVESNEFFSRLSCTNNYWTAPSLDVCVGRKKQKVEIDKAAEMASGGEQFLWMFMRECASEVKDIWQETHFFLFLSIHYLLSHTPESTAPLLTIYSHLLRRVAGKVPQPWREDKHLSHRVGAYINVHCICQGQCLFSVSIEAQHVHFLARGRTVVQSPHPPVKSGDGASTTDGDRAVLSGAAALFGELYPWQLGSSYQSMRLELYWHARWRRPRGGDRDHSVWRWHTARSASELGCRQHLSLSGISEVRALA